MLNAFEETPARDRVIVALDCGIDEAFDRLARMSIFSDSAAGE